MRLWWSNTETTTLKWHCSEQDFLHMWVTVFFLSHNSGISYTFHRYEKAVIAMAKQSVTLEVLSYHASASLDDAQRLRVSSAQGIDAVKLWES